MREYSRLARKSICQKHTHVLRDEIGSPLRITRELTDTRLTRRLIAVQAHPALARGKAESLLERSTEVG